MKITLLTFIIVLVVTSINGQKPKLRIFKDSKIKIINFVIEKDPNKLPLLTFTILNKTKQSIIFNSILLNLIEFKKHPSSSSSENGLISKALTPIAGLDLSLPTQENTYLYGLSSPLQIISKDAITIQIRIHCDLGKKVVVPSQLGGFKFVIFFVTYDYKTIKSDEIEMGY